MAAAITKAAIHNLYTSKREKAFTCFLPFLVSIATWTFIFKNIKMDLQATFFPSLQALD